MDDQFLHRLRRDPPTGFATRLKWQLDRPAASRPSRLRLLLVLAIFGTAFALVSPPARRALINLFVQAPGNPQATPRRSDPPQPPRPSAAGVYREAESARSPPSPRARAPIPPVAEPQTDTAPMPPEGAVDAQPAAPDVPPVAVSDLKSNFVISPITNSGPQTPQQQAIAAVLTRQGLFRVLSVLNSPLRLMRQQHMPVDMQVAGVGANRLAELSSLIPEVFSKDTRPFAVDTRALDVIWMQPEDFASKSEELTLAADALHGAAASRDEGAALKAIDRIQMACRGCHDVYRKN
ncbi:MAG TPA: cytochrome c [Steroidobacteraceae bacterium]